MNTNCRVLVVDDSAVSRKFLERKLAHLGYNVAAVEGGAQALERARAAPPSVIVTDLHMPIMDGYDLCRAVRCDPALSSVIVIVTSASEVDALDLQKARDAGAAAIVPRTALLQEVLSALSNAIADSALLP